MILVTQALVVCVCMHVCVYVLKPLVGCGGVSTCVLMRVCDLHVLVVLVCAICSLAVIIYVLFKQL